MIPKLLGSLVLCEISLREKSSFLKKVKPRKPLYSCSRIRVGEGSPKKKEIKKKGTSVKKPSRNYEQKRVGRVMQKSLKNHPKVNQTWSQKPLKKHPKMDVKFERKTGFTHIPCFAPQVIFFKKITSRKTTRRGTSERDPRRTPTRPGA